MIGPGVQFTAEEMTAMGDNDERMMKWFDYEHLPDKLKEVSRKFWLLADYVASAIEQGPERTVALRKLLEAKDAAVRAALHPGG